MEKEKEPHKLKAMSDKYIRAFSECLDDGNSPSEALVGALIYFIQLEIRSSDDIATSVNMIQEIINHSVAEAQEEVEGL